MQLDLRPRSLLTACCATLLVSAAHGQSACDYAIQFGMNPSFHTWSSRGIVFADAMTRAKDFELIEGDSLGRAERIADGLLGAGWPDPATLGPGQEFGALIFGQMDGSLPDGREQPYVVTWEGSGEVRLTGLFVMEERSRTSQRAEFVIDASISVENTGLSVHWSAPDAGDPVRNIRVWLPGMENAGKILWPPYIEKVRMLNSGRGPSSWRTLDWTRVNDYGTLGPDALFFHSQRPRHTGKSEPGHASGSRHGIPGCLRQRSGRRPALPGPPSRQHE